MLKKIKNKISILVKLEKKKTPSSGDKHVEEYLV